MHCLALLSKVLSDVNMMLKAANNLEQDEFDDLTFLVGKAIEAVNSWKAHQLRVVHQDHARLDVIDKLCKSKVLITQDFAMKCLPMQFIERHRMTSSVNDGCHGISL